VELWRESVVRSWVVELTAWYWLEEADVWEDASEPNGMAPEKVDRVKGDGYAE